jgi:hypothetical protein
MAIDGSDCEARLINCDNRFDSDDCDVMLFNARRRWETLAVDGSSPDFLVTSLAGVELLFT